MEMSTDRDGDTYSHLVPYLMNRAVRGFNREWLTQLRAHGVTIAQWQVLAILSDYDGARLGQLATMSGVEQPVASRVVDQMERAGLVRRRAAPDDGRAVEVWLTGKGGTLFSGLLPEADQLVVDAMRGVDAQTARTLMEALSTVISNLDGPGGAPAGKVGIPDESGGITSAPGRVK